MDTNVSLENPKPPTTGASPGTQDLPGQDGETSFGVSSQSLRNRGRTSDTTDQTGDLSSDPKVTSLSSFVDILEDPFIQGVDSDVEAHKISNNYLFGFKKWKGHVTDRPLNTRSEVVQNLYEDFDKIKPVNVSTARPSNILYVLLFGWWMALLYLIVGCLMFITLVGWNYGVYCWTLARYFLWPFGKFVHLVHPTVKRTCSPGLKTYTESEGGERTGLLEGTVPSLRHHTSRLVFFKSPVSYLWLVLGVPVLVVAHFIIMFFTWLFVVSMPVAKLNFKAITQILFMPPQKLKVADYSYVKEQHQDSEILMYTHQSVYLYYYKYSVDGMNIILFNLLVFVILALALGYTDPDNKITTGITKCILGVCAIIPLTYYIGLAIISISAQSNFAVGAVLNATFGSIVEIIIFVLALSKGSETGSDCYAELVKSSLTGSIVGSLLFIPGICMVIGGIKYHSQRFNPRAANVTALLMFVAVGGVYAPTMFAKIFGDMQCKSCDNVYVMPNGNTSVNPSNSSYSLHCTQCQSSVAGLDGDSTLYRNHVMPLVYACSVLLPIAYLIGMVFALKTHSASIYQTDHHSDLAVEGDHHKNHNHGSPSWSRIKSFFILLLSATLIALCAELITQNLQELVQTLGVSEFFLGMTMFAMVPELPEIVNGIQFALLNNVNLGIEIGTSTAIQVCMIQVPILVLINIIHPFGFLVLFNDIHLWAVVFSVIVINYTFQDGKSDYFQGFTLVILYVILLITYYFIPVPTQAKC
ncbi:putative cation exchanger C521.04c [Mizuhopecten yessoensis]|uniref:Cation exchanger n=1 Tax=Mizuhopecten yessoensis TaxID=6573 RepID=A0A210PXS2_MIZYE|nr:putative cation exchanger C521.04c [Mizuhopecten yessoensis]OWF41281.1 Cation exchanger [Mizuhopecten yessoensis]